MHTRQSLYFSGPYEMEVRSETISSPQAGEVLVETAVSAISAGTEMLFYRGQVPPGMSVDSSIDSLQNQVSYPLKYGYALVGSVSELGSGVDAGWLGKKVFLFHPHESHVVAPVSNLIEVPGDITAENAVFLPFMETAVSFLMDGRPLIGEKVAILGQGIVGLLAAALLAHYPLTRLAAFDRFPLRLHWSRQLGAHSAFDAGEEDFHAALDEINQTDPTYSGFDLVYELTGQPQALNQAIKLTGYGGRIVIGSWYGQKQAPIALGEHFHRSHMHLISSQVSSIAPEWRGRFDHTRRLQVAWSQIAAHHPQKLISHRFPIAQAAEAYKLIDQKPGETLQIIFTY